MQRRSFLKSIASVAGVKALAPLAPLMLIPNWRTDSSIVNSKPSPEKAAMMDGNAPPIRWNVDPEEVKRLIARYANEIRYPLEIDCSEWSASRTLICAGLSAKLAQKERLDPTASP